VATAVHVTRTRQFAYVGAGPFGRRVVEFLAELGDAHATHSQEEVEAALAADAGSVAVAMWRPDPDLCEQADAAAYRIGRPWLPIVMEHPVIYVGPVIQPPHGPCFRCMLRRRAQHDVHHAATAAVHAAYAADRNRGPAGYLPQHARMAAAVAHRMLWHPGVPISDGSGVGRNVVMLMLDDGLLMTYPVIRCGDCRRCRGAEQPEPVAGQRQDLLKTISVPGRAR
jgi:bacteriocin biosynthesis cyclodehydratase domain-containing protein